ncbi:BTAD domain-containing putative transcriptional regulator [Kineococcus sp. GCM10028916]
MLALYRASRRREALAAYGEAHEFIDRELGVASGLEQRRST